MKKKMIDVRVFDKSESVEKIRLYNIEGTDDYYASGKAFAVKNMRHSGGLYFYDPDSYALSTDLPDYVRDIYFMIDGELMPEIVYRNPGYKKSILIAIYMYDNEGFIRLNNIEGTDDYYMSGSEFDKFKWNDCDIKWVFMACLGWREREDSKGVFDPVTGLPDRVRRVYRMDDGEITDLLYENPNYMAITR